MTAGLDIKAKLLKLVIEYPLLEKRANGRSLALSKHGYVDEECLHYIKMTEQLATRGF